MAADLFFIGMAAGLLTAWGLVQQQEMKAQAELQLPNANQQTIAQMQRDFLPAAEQAIQTLKTQDPQAASSWKKVAGYIPGLTESVAMYYALLDPDVPLGPKATIAGSLAYMISPIDIVPDYIPGFGRLDDLGVLLVAFRMYAESMKQEHFDQARRWLRSQGIEPTPIAHLGLEPGQMSLQQQFTPDFMQGGVRQLPEMPSDVIDALEASQAQAVEVQPPAPPPTFDR